MKKIGDIVITNRNHIGDGKFCLHLVVEDFGYDKIPELNINGKSRCLGKMRTILCDIEPYKCDNVWEDLIDLDDDNYPDSRFVSKLDSYLVTLNKLDNSTQLIHTETISNNLFLMDGETIIDILDDDNWEDAKEKYEKVLEELQIK